MSKKLQGTTISIDHYTDSTWREEFFTEQGTDYLVRIHRERLGFADVAETVLITKEQGDVPVTDLGGGDYDPGKPRSISFMLSDLLTFGASIDITATAVAYGVDLQAITLTDIFKFIVLANETVINIANERRILDYKLANAIITSVEYADAVSLLMPINIE